MVRMNRFRCLRRHRNSAIFFLWLSIFVIFYCGILCAHCDSATAINGSINRFITFVGDFRPTNAFYSTICHMKINKHKPILHRLESNKWFLCWLPSSFIAPFTVWPETQKQITRVPQNNSIINIRLGFK